MKQKFFVLSAIVLIAVVGLFIFEHATSAQRPDRGEQSDQPERGDRPGGRDMARMFNPMSIVDNSWLDLTFSVKVDDETLVKARPIYQAARDKFETKLKEIRASGDFRTAMQEMRTFVTTTGNEFKTDLKKVLTEEQITKLDELTKKRQVADQQRRNRSRGGQGGGGEGGQRGAR